MDGDRVVDDGERVLSLLMTCVERRMASCLLDEGLVAIWRERLIGGVRGWSDDGGAL